MTVAIAVHTRTALRVTPLRQGLSTLHDLSMGVATVHEQGAEAAESAALSTTEPYWGVWPLLGGWCLRQPSPMGVELFEEMTKSQCINLRSFRKDGTPVDTPLWVVPTGPRSFASYTDDRTFKAKRVRRNPQVEVAACDVWGRVSTPWYAAVCNVVREESRREEIFGLIREKYGIHWYLSLWGSLLTRRVPHRLVLEYVLDDERDLLVPAVG